METNKRFKFLTNNFVLPALTIAQIYKSRWQVELFFENSTWCTPLDVMEFRVSIALNRPLVGSLVGSVRPRISRRPRAAVVQGAPTQACVAGNCFNRDHPQDSDRRDAEDCGAFTDGHLVAGLSLSLTVDRNRVVVAQRADPFRSPALSVCREAIRASGSILASVRTISTRSSSVTYRCWPVPSSGTLPACDPRLANGAPGVWSRLHTWR